MKGSASITNHNLDPARNLNEEQRDHIYSLTITDPHIKIRELVDEVDEVVKERSIRKLLNETGRRNWRQLRRPKLTEQHARKRLAWADEYENFTPQDWAKVRWSDECTIERGTGIQPVWTFRRPYEQLVEHDICTHYTGKKCQTDVLAAFGEDIYNNASSCQGSH